MITPYARLLDLTEGASAGFSLACDRLTFPRMPTWRSSDLSGPLPGAVAEAIARAAAMLPRRRDRQHSAD